MSYDKTTALARYNTACAAALANYKLELQAEREQLKQDRDEERERQADQRAEQREQERAQRANDRAAAKSIKRLLAKLSAMSPDDAAIMSNQMLRIELEHKLNQIEARND